MANPEAATPDLPVAPLGWLNEVYDEVYIREDNFFAKFSVTTLDPDIE